jgi:hypothetical protein
MNRLLTCGIIVANGLVPCGPGMGCHVGACFWVFKIFMESIGFEPRTSTHMQSLFKVLPTNAPHYVSCYIYEFIYI